jgi:hypothetical protein
VAPALATAVDAAVAGIYSVFYLGYNLLIGLTGIALAIYLQRAQNSLSPASASPANGDASPPGKPGRMVLIRRSLAQFARIAAVFVPVTLVFAVLINIRQAAAALESLDPFFSSLGLPSAAAFVIVAGVPSTISGIAAIGPIYQNGLLTSKDVIITLLLASVAHTVYEFFASFLPANLAVFGPTRGWRLSIVAVLVRLGAIAVLMTLAIAIL